MARQFRTVSVVALAAFLFVGFAGWMGWHIWQAQSQPSPSDWSAAIQGLDRDAHRRASPRFAAASNGRVAVLAALESAESTGALATQLGMPSSPSNEAELATFVAWMRSMSREDLLRLTNAEYGFRPSALVELLRGLDGAWVVPAMGDLAVAEADDLVRATLVRAVCTALCCGRLRDPAYGPVVERLLPIFTSTEADPFEVGSVVVSRLFEISTTQGVNYAATLMPLLEAADNPSLLVHGFLFLGRGPEAKDFVVRNLVHHSSPDGRLGALEALRLGRGVSADELAEVAASAVVAEGNPRNRMLLVELLGSRGGEAGSEALAGMLLGGDHELAGFAAPMLAYSLPPVQALETLRSAMDGLAEGAAIADGAGNADPAGRREREAALWRAIAAVPGPEAMETLLDAARDPEQPTERRVMALGGLGLRELDDAAVGELRGWVDGEQPAELRAEALKWLALQGAAAPGDRGADGARAIADGELRALAVADPAPEVRAQAVAMAALRLDPDARGWLEERLLTDKSPEVRAQALGALVVHAHYSGEGDGVLDHLRRARRLVQDPELLVLLDRGEEMVRSFDPRRLELELEREAAFYAKVAPMLEGSAGMAMRHQASLQANLVAALRAGRR